MKHIIGLDAKRIVRNATGLGSYGRTLVNDLLRTAADDYLFRLYAPDEGREDLRQQVLQYPNLEFCYPLPMGEGLGERLFMAHLRHRS